MRSVFEPDGTNNLEGLLWPDTYKVAAEEDEIDVLKTMVQLFDKRMAALGVGYRQRAGLRAVRHHQDRVADRSRGEGRLQTARSSRR